MSNTPTIDRPTPYPNKVEFGPGALESITLVSWVSHHQRWVRVKGTYTVYCGLGNSHTVEVDERGVLDDVIVHDGFHTSHEDVAQALVNLAMDDWSDPCEDGQP